jgi:hypothetical protein
MKNKQKSYAVLLILLITMSSFITKKQSATDQVMIYGIVYTNQCNSEAYEYYTYKVVGESSYHQEERNMESKLRNDYPNAKRIKVGSSRFDYGKSATNMCIIKWQVKGNNCTYHFAAAYFGKSESDALNNAISKKNTWAGQNASYSILIEKYW